MRLLRLSSVVVLASFSACLALGCSGSTDKGNGEGDDTGVAPSDGSGGDSSGNGDTSAVDDTGGGDEAGDSTVDNDTGGATDSGSIEDTNPIDAGDGGQIIPGCGLDSDGDGIADSVEGRATKLDTDGDGIPDYLDDDSDDDTIPDKVEWITVGCATTPFDDKNDADGDGTPNFQDTDSDDNGLVDRSEACPPKVMPGAPASCTGAAPEDWDGDGDGDWVDADNDHDSSSTDKHQGLLDKFETTNSAGAYVGLIDTDGDKVFDLYDRDSDGDFILDQDDGVGDPDGDGKRNFQDLDSDGDAVGDTCEARDSATAGVGDYNKPLLDTDKDGTPDYLDRDTDADLLGDGQEDKNGNCIVDANETNRVQADTDGDGVSDFIEVTVVNEACANNKACTPANQGVFYFIEPYSADGSAAPTPSQEALALSTSLNQGDVGFVVDVTGSMGGELNNLKTSLSSTITSLKTRIPDLGIGVAGFSDVPDGNYGGCTQVTLIGGVKAGPDRLFYVPTGGYVQTDATTAQNAVNGLTFDWGDDLPEASVPALLRAIRGDALSWTAANGCPAGSKPVDNGDGGVTTFGGLHFRKSALPILVDITDARFHNGTYVGTSGFHDTYTGDAASMPTASTLLAAINAANAKFIGGAACDGSYSETDANIRSTSNTSSPYADMAYFTDNTGSNVPPSAFGGSCKTGLGGAVVGADGPGGNCRLIFSIHNDGTGLTNSIVDGVYALLNAIKFDVHVQAIPTVTGGVDPVDAFMSSVDPQPSGGTDPVTGKTCVTFSATADNFTGPKATAGGDGRQDTILQVNPGSYYCFNVVPKPNTSVPAQTTAQTFIANLRVLAKNGTSTLVLGSDRPVTFVVPPVQNF